MSLTQRKASSWTQATVGISLGAEGLGFRGLGFGVLGVEGLGYRVSGFMGLRV